MKRTWFQWIFIFFIRIQNSSLDNFTSYILCRFRRAVCNHLPVRPIDTPKSFAVQEGLFHFFQDKLRDLHGSPFYITSTSNQYPYMTDLFDVEFVGTMADYLYAISTLPRTQRWLCSKTIGEKWQIYNFNLDSNISPDIQFSYLYGSRISHRGKNLLFSHMTWLYFIHIGTFSISF